MDLSSVWFPSELWWFELCVVSLRAVGGLSYTVSGLLKSCGGFDLCAVSFRAVVV